MQINRVKKIKEKVEHDRAIDLQEEISDCFLKQPKEARILFGKYLRIQNKINFLPPNQALKLTVGSWVQITWRATVSFLIIKSSA